MANDTTNLAPFATALAGPAPARLADLDAIVRDLQYAAAAFRQSMEETPIPMLQRALWDSAAIAYRRSFTTGRSLLKGHSRARVPDEIIETLPEPVRAVHEELLEIANKHIAHRTGRREGAKVILLLRNPALGMEAEGVIVFSTTFIAPAPERAHAAALLAERLEEAIREEVTSIQKSILADAKNRDLSVLYSTASPLEIVEA